MTWRGTKLALKRTLGQETSSGDGSWLFKNPEQESRSEMKYYSEIGVGGLETIHRLDRKVEGDGLLRCSEYGVDFGRGLSTGNLNSKSEKEYSKWIEGITGFAKPKG
jgi:hypothetical protein